MNQMNVTSLTYVAEARCRIACASNALAVQPEGELAWEVAALLTTAARFLRLDVERNVPGRVSIALGLVERGIDELSQSLLGLSGVEFEIAGSAVRDRLLWAGFALDDRPDVAVRVLCELVDGEAA